VNEREVLAFRMILAEEGTEMTPEDAEKAFLASKSIMKTSKRMSMIDLWNLEDCVLEGMDDKQKKELVNLYKNAKEL
jgi:hypothetical protein